MTMIACIDAFGQSTSQANYFEGFWRITSKINAENPGKKTVRMAEPAMSTTRIL